MEYKIVIDQKLVDEYCEYYFKQHPRARKKPIERPRHPFLNQWMVMSRIRANTLKQTWKHFICWVIEKYGYTGLMLDKVEMIQTTYLETRRKADVDGTTPKFILDGFTEAGFLAADDYTCLQSLTLKMGYDKKNPRTEILIKAIKEGE